MINLIKFIHTVIWAVLAAACLFILYAGITNTIDWRTKSSVILVGIEVAVLLFNKWTCPLTPLAKKYTSNRNPNFDIYLPNWLAKHNKFIFGAIFVVGLGLVGWRVACMVFN